MPKDQITQCHAFVKELLANNVSSEDLLGEDTTLEQKRVESDYFLDARVSKADYELALRAKENLIQHATENPEFLGFEDQKRDFYRRFKQGNLD